ncbi:MAG TPA: hypothetical protein VGE74_30170 [Gemmata sp.]
MPVIGLGDKIQVDDGNADAFVDIEDVVNLNVPDDEYAVVESKRLNLAADKQVRKVLTMKDAGEFTFQYEFSADKKSRLDALKGAAKNFKIILNSDGETATWTATFPGSIRSNKVEQVAPDEIKLATCTVVVTGPIAIS